MPTITTKTVKQSKTPCGFCSTGHRHDLCPGGVLNGNQTEIVLCGCTQHPIELRCLDCGLRGDGVSPVTWQCEDQDDCSTRRTARREKTLRDLYGTTETGEPLRAVPVKEKAPKAPPKPKTGSCLCCGETTGGGLFKPGHDSKYLTRAVESIKGGKYTLAEVLELMTTQGISEALKAKLAKRVA